MDPKDSIENPVGWRCTGYTHGCFCPTCSQRDIDRAEYLELMRRGHAVANMLRTVAKGPRHG